MRCPSAYSTADRLEAYSEPDTNGGCVLWSGSTNRGGYGQIRIGTKMTRAHRVAWTLVNGPPPQGSYVLHRCDVRACVNPGHMFLGTHADNMADMAVKGRRRSGDLRGEKHGRAKITDADVRSIRLLLSAGERQRDIARSFGLSRATISHIKTGYSWAHLPENSK